MIVLSQIVGIALYEFRMHWRRRGLLVVTLGMLGVTLLPIMLVRNELSSDSLLGAEGVEYFTRNVIRIHWAAVGAVLFAVMPFIFADAIPRDRQIGVSEVLHTTPMRSLSYLAGKTLGAWLGTITCLILTVVTSGAAWWIVIAPFDLSVYSAIWISGALPMALINVGLVVLITSVLPDSRTAVLGCVAFVVLLPILVGIEGSGTAIELLNPLRPGLFFFYLQQAAPTQSQALSPEVTILGGVVQLIAAAVGAWLWARFRDGR